MNELDRVQELLKEYKDTTLKKLFRMGVKRVSMEIVNKNFENMINHIELMKEMEDE